MIKTAPWFKDVCANLSMALNTVMGDYDPDQLLQFRWVPVDNDNYRDVPMMVIGHLFKRDKGFFARKSMKYEAIPYQIALPNPLDVMGELKAEWRKKCVPRWIHAPRLYIYTNENISEQILQLYKYVIAHTNSLWIEDDVERQRFDECGFVLEERLA